jgi:acetyl esterase
MLSLLFALALAASPKGTHVHLAVKDLQKSAAFYRDAMGFTQVHLDNELGIFDLGSFQLFLGPSRLQSPARTAGAPEGIAVAVEVEDVDRAVAAVQAKGVSPTRFPSTQFFGRSAMFRDPDGYTLELEATFPETGWRKGIEYSEHQLLDAYLPDGPGPHPAVIVVHGGGFVAGDRQSFVFPLFAPLIAAGFAIFTIDYRLAPKHRHPAQLDDVEAAIAWVKKFGPAMETDPKRLFLLGESAGGYLASFAAARGGQGLAGVVAMYGAHDLLSRLEQQGKIADSIKALLGVGDPSPAVIATLKKASPSTYVKPGMPPLLLIHGELDEQVPYLQSVQMCERVRAAGNRCELFTVKGGVHGLQKWELVAGQTAYKAKLLEWLKAQ